MNKVILFLLCLLLGSVESFSQKTVETDYYTNHPDLGGEVVIKNATSEALGDQTTVSFEVEAQSADKYYLNFWLLPAKLQDGTFARYNVSVNGVILQDEIVPTRGDWQSITLSRGEAIALSKGSNTISIIGAAPDVPCVEHIKLSQLQEDSVINSSAYDSYKSLVEKESAENAMYNTATTALLKTDTLDNEIMALSATEDPLYNYTYSLNMCINYTFYKTVSFTEGEQVFVATNGIDNFSHVLELFSTSKPEDYSWASMSNDNCMASLNISIPATGLYYVRVRSYLNARSGLCNVNINGENYYENVSVYSIGVRCLQETDKIYNTFTCCSSGDPRLRIEEGTSIPGKISAFNDDYGTQGDFSWGRNARIKKQYSRPVHAALLSTYSSYKPTAKCDLYIK